MDANDARHGTPAGRSQHMRDGEHPCPDCSWAHTVANKRRNLSGGPGPKVPSLGSQRRVRALQAIGYGKRRITHELGYSNEGSISYLMNSKTMLRVTADRIEAVYDRLSMTVPQGHVADRTRRWAARSGFPPPLAWDNIDDPDEKPRRGRDRNGPSSHELDPVVVARILAGDWRLRATDAERRAVVAAWGGSLRELGVRTGWKVERYIDREDVAS